MWLIAILLDNAALGLKQLVPIEETKDNKQYLIKLHINKRKTESDK